MISKRISHHFQNLQQEIIDEILEESTLLNLAPGDYLIKQGKETTTLYFLTSGRLRSVLKDSKSTKILGDICPGEPVGELAFLRQPQICIGISH